MIVMLNKLLPKIFPRESPGFFSHTVDDKLVSNSGSDVTADKRTPPINAPDNFVFLSNKSTYIDALIDNIDYIDTYSEIHNLFKELDEEEKEEEL